MQYFYCLHVHKKYKITIFLHEKLYGFNAGLLVKNLESMVLSKK